MIKPSLFADQEREAKLNELGDTLRVLEQEVDFAALTRAVDAAASRPCRERGGRPPFPKELMVRVLLIQQLLNLSDEQMEFQLLDRPSFQRFVGLRHSSRILDRTTIWTFKELLIQASASESIFDVVNRQLSMHDYTTRGGQMLDASIVQTPKQSINKEEKAIVTEDAIRGGRFFNRWVAEKSNSAKQLFKKKGSSHMRFSVKRLHFWLLVALLGVLSACGHATTAQNRSDEISLSLEGYNYTSRYIDSFTVNGQGGGNIYVSSPTSGGGGTVCCVSFFPLAPQQTVRVRWAADACYFLEKSSFSDQMYETLYSFYKEQDVPVEVLAKDNAKYMEVHFYPNGSIRAAITPGISPPRIVLEKQREDRSRYPRCSGDLKPQK